MIWIIILIAGALLIKLGALSVLVNVPAFSLKAVIGLVAVFVRSQKNFARRMCISRY
jgi:hypothetical protein